jgi:heme exporter protein A
MNMNFIANNAVLKVDNLVGVRGDRLLFENVNFEMNQGSVLYLQGANGAGKTTLLRMLCGLSKPYAGNISWCGENIDNLAEEYYQHVLYIGHLSGIKEDLTALENLQFSIALSGKRVTEKQAAEVLNALGLSKGLNLPTRMLSQGQKRRVALARLWLQDAPLWILDEPFTALDVKATALLKQKIEAFACDGGMVVMTTHQEFTLNIPKFSQLRLDENAVNNVA